MVNSFIVENWISFQSFYQSHGKDEDENREEEKDWFLNTS